MPRLKYRGHRIARCPPGSGYFLRAKTIAAGLGAQARRWIDKLPEVILRGARRSVPYGCVINHGSGRRSTGCLNQPLRAPNPFPGKHRTPEFSLPFEMPVGLSDCKGDMVPRAGLEPARPEGQRILSPQRLPIPPPGQPRRYRITALWQTLSATMARPRNAIRTAETSKLIPAGAPVYSIARLRTAPSARWQSGYAAACKAVDAGSIPTLASNKRRFCAPAAWSVADVVSLQRAPCALPGRKTDSSRHRPNRGNRP